uniref:Uncharacterized protein n=1 Tax=Strombidium rassoulzadegani TaxID=1082188 RepID=A0A7S3FYM3_9SPIT
MDLLLGGLVGKGVLFGADGGCSGPGRPLNIIDLISWPGGRCICRLCYSAGRLSGLIGVGSQGIWLEGLVDLPRRLDDQRPPKVVPLVIVEVRAQICLPVDIAHHEAAPTVQLGALVLLVQVDLVLLLVVLRHEVLALLGARGPGEGVVVLGSAHFSRLLP